MFKGLGSVPVLIFVAVIATLAMLDIRTVFKFPLIPVVGYFFAAAVASVVAYISAKSYLQDGSPLILLLGSGVLALGSSSLLAGLTIGYMGGTGNIAGTIYETGLLVASALHFQSAFAALLGAPSQEELQNRRTWVILANLGVVTTITLVTIATFQGVTPAFYIEKAGATPLLTWVAGVSCVLFAISFLILMRLYSRSRSDILYWYSLAIALMAAARFGFSLVEIADTPIHWAARFAQYLGAFYLLVAVLVSVKGEKRP